YLRKTGASARPWLLAPLPLGSLTLLLLAASVGYGSVPSRSQAPRALVMPPAAQSFLRENCQACHSGPNASGKLDLTTAFRPEDASNFNRWVRVIDRVSAGEMPPKAAPQPTPAARKSFLAALSQPLYAVEEARVRREARATWRRMN